MIRVSVITIDFFLPNSIRVASTSQSRNPHAKIIEVRRGEKRAPPPFVSVNETISH